MGVVPFQTTTMKSHILILTNIGHAPLLARLVEPGDPFGLNFQMVAEGAIVEFYDTKFQHTDFGQFISRYSLRTLLENPEPTGINLYGGVSPWILTPHEHVRLMQWLKTVAAQYIPSSTEMGASA